jgi:hypothetical protein
MSKKFLVGIDATAGVEVTGGNVSVASGYLDLTKNELRNARVQNLASDPASPVAGQIYFNTTSNDLKFYDGTSWSIIAVGSDLTFGTPSTLAAGGTNTEGTSSSAARADHVHALPSFGSVTAETSYGGTSANGSATTFARSDHTHGTPSLTNDSPATQAIGDTAVVGTATSPARADHKHAMPAFGNVVSQTSFGSSATNGSSADLARADHTHGTPAHDAAAHSAIKVSDLAAPTANIDLNNNKITNLSTPTNPGDAANKGYVDAAVAGVDWKQSVRAATTANITLSNEQTVDGISLVAGNRVLVKNQTTATQNGVYVVVDGGSWTRSLDANENAEVTSGFAVFVEEGTVNADSGWVLTTDGSITVGSTSLTFTQFTGLGQVTAGDGLTKTGNVINAVGGTGIAITADAIAVDRTTNGAKVALIHSESIGDGTATSYTVTHGLGSKDVGVTIYDNASPYAEVFADVEHTSTTAVTIKFAAAPTANKYRVVVFG